MAKHQLRSWERYLKNKLGACEAALKWCRTCRDAKHAWTTCADPKWMIWLLKHTETDGTLRILFRRIMLRGWRLKKWDVGTASVKLTDYLPDKRVCGMLDNAARGEKADDQSCMMLSAIIANFMYRPGWYVPTALDNQCIAQYMALQAVKHIAHDLGPATAMENCLGILRIALGLNSAIKKERKIYETLMCNAIREHLPVPPAMKK